MKNEEQHRLLFIIPAVIIAIILIICIAVAVSSNQEKGEEKDSRSVSVTENTQDIVAESETLELVKRMH